MQRGRSTEALIFVAFVICVSLFFVNELRIYDQVALQRVAQVREQQCVALKRQFEDVFLVFTDTEFRNVNTFVRLCNQFLKEIPTLKYVHPLLR